MVSLPVQDAAAAVTDMPETRRAGTGMQGDHEAQSPRNRAAMLGHDIRAAISDILGGLALADLSVLDLTSRLQLQRVQSSAEQLLRLTDETLALVTGDDSPRADPPVQTSLGPFLDRIAARWHAHAGARGLGFCLDRADDLPTAIGTDPAALERILSNMIANAVKYSPVGEVRLRVHLGPQEALCLRVRDTGPGFSEAAMARLFDFAGRPEDSGQPGTGLGLHIARDLAQRIRGQIHVANAAEGGAEVSLILPRRAWAPGIETPLAAADLPDLGGCSVLVAEDNPTNRLLVQQMLETLGAEVTLVEDGEAAAEALTVRRFDLVLVDIEMPRLSGIDVIRRLRAAEGDGPASPVLAITAFVLSANRDQIYDAGADGILAKPILSLDAFGEAIARVLTKRTAPLSGTKTGVPFDPVHLDRLLALAGPEDGRELLRRMREDFGTVERGLNEGRARDDLALIRTRTHVLISLAGAVGNVILQAEAEALNAAARSHDRATVARLLPMVLHGVARLRAALGGELDARFAMEAAG